jgi:hypothetical protein
MQQLAKVVKPKVPLIVLAKSTVTADLQVCLMLRLVYDRRILAVQSAFDPLINDAGASGAPMDGKDLTLMEEDRWHSTEA